MKRLGISILALLMTSIVACDSQGVDPRITMSDGWVRAMPPGATATSAYGKLTNEGGSPIKIEMVSSDSFSSAGLHESRVVQGVNQMESHSSWMIAPGGHLELQPGGMHFMLMQPTRVIEVGSEIALILVDESGMKYEFRLPVETR